MESNGKENMDMKDDLKTDVANGSKKEGIEKLKKLSKYTVVIARLLYFSYKASEIVEHLLSIT